MIRLVALPDEWRGEVDVAFGPARFGWLPMRVSTPVFGQSTVADCSDVFPPFDDLLAWLHAVIDASLPATMTIDAESAYTSLLALKTAGEADLVEFAVIHHDGLSPDPDAAPALRCCVSRLGLVREFAHRLESWIERDYDPRDFGCFGIESPDPPHPENLHRLDFGPLWARLPGGRDGQAPQASGGDNA